MRASSARQRSDDDARHRERRHETEPEWHETDRTEARDGRHGGQDE